MAIGENSIRILNYLKENRGNDPVTAKDIAAALDLAPRSVEGSLTAMSKKGLVVRIPSEVTLDDGTHKAVKVVEATDAGMTYDPTAVDEAAE